MISPPAPARQRRAAKPRAIAQALLHGFATALGVGQRTQRREAQVVG